MRHDPIDPQLFKTNRERLKSRLPKNSLALVNANDVLPANADGTLPLQPNSDLFYLTGIEQEESVLMMAPDALDPRYREVLFIRQPNAHLATWEGHKLGQEKARGISGIETIKWLTDFPKLFHQAMCAAENVFLNSNEHMRAVVEVESRDARFIRECQRRYPLHRYERLARLMHPLRALKSPQEIELIRRACAITKSGFERVLRSVKPGAGEWELEAEFAHEFTRERARFAYAPIIASGANSCVLHYVENSRRCKRGDLLLLDVAASYANYNSDLTRTVPVSGRFSRRQKQVYRSVLRVLRAMTEAALPGKLHGDWQKESEQLVQNELLELGLLRSREIQKQSPEEPALKRYFMHGVGHPLGLDVHDVGFLSEPFAPGWVLTVEPGIYIPEEGFGIRLENNILLTDTGSVDLMADIPVEPEAIEEAMNH